MLIHGRLILTAHGYMLDEVKSLLQKSLRRKHSDFVAQSTKELVCYGKDQLPWKSLVTYLFEDHCLSHIKVLQVLHECFLSRDKVKAVNVLFECYTCRIAACLPVIAMEERYATNFWNSQIKCPENECGLVSSKPRSLNFDVILAHLGKAWERECKDELITCIKLCTIVYDTEKRTVTCKGGKYLISQTKKPNVGHVVMSFLYKHSDNSYWKHYMAACFKLLDIPEVCVRLVLCAAVTNMIFSEHIMETDTDGTSEWQDIGPLSTMPTWAVDKHTFRGKCGKGSKHLLKKTHPKLTAEQLEEFHGSRPKSGIKEFFEEGCLCNKQSDVVNPYWERTQQIYYSQTTRLQKTVRMTQVYYKTLKEQHPYLFTGKSKEAASSQQDTNPGISTRKRVTKNKVSLTKNDEPPCKKLKTNEGDTKPSEKILNQDSQQASCSRPGIDSLKKGHLKQTTPGSIKESQTKGSLPQHSSSSSKESLTKTSKTRETDLKGPLLQLPTSSTKVYTCLRDNQVWKGPYREHKFNLTLFYHSCLGDVFDDLHTLKVKDMRPYLVFPLIKGTSADLKTTYRDYYDCILKQQVQNGEFINRENLGIIQLHKISPNKISSLPFTIWLHFIFRYLLNVGDSGLYNTIADHQLSAIYGIDMEECRGQVRGARVIDLIFTKLPAKVMCEKITVAVRSAKTDIIQRLEELYNQSYIDRLQLMADTHHCTFDKNQFTYRLKDVTTALNKL